MEYSQVWKIFRIDALCTVAFVKHSINVDEITVRSPERAKLHTFKEQNFVFLNIPKYLCFSPESPWLSTDTDDLCSIKV